MQNKQPVIRVMGELVNWDDVPGTGATGIEDYFKPVKLSGKAINAASRVVPHDVWMSEGLYTWLQRRADHVFKNLKIGELEGRLGKMKYVFEFDADGVVLKTVFLG